MKTSKTSDFKLTIFCEQYFRRKLGVFLMKQLGPSRERISSHFTHFCKCARLFKRCKTRTIGSHFTIFYKRYLRSIFDVFLMALAGPSEERNLISHFIHCCSSALRDKESKTSENLIQFYCILMRQFRSKFDVFLMSQVETNEERNQCSLVSLLHFCTLA